jgi:hypothetical protein
MKLNASSRIIVPKVMPRKRCERSFTQSKNGDTPPTLMSVNVLLRIASQVSLRLSHISIVTAPRWARAFSRAVCSEE